MSERENRRVTFYRDDGCVGTGTSACLDPWVWSKIYAHLESRGELRDPGEPTLAEVRERVADARNCAVGEMQRLSGEGKANRRGFVQAYDSVLALLEPRKPEPQFKPGDWVMPGPGGMVYVEGPVDRHAVMNLAFLVTHAKSKIHAVDVQGIPVILSGSTLRLATSEEIAKARGDATSRDADERNTA